MIAIAEPSYYWTSLVFFLFRHVFCYDHMGSLSLKIDFILSCIFFTKVHVLRFLEQVVLVFSLSTLSVHKGGEQDNFHSCEELLGHA